MWRKHWTYQRVTARKTRQDTQHFTLEGSVPPYTAEGHHGKVIFSFYVYIVNPHNWVWGGQKEEELEERMWLGEGTSWMSWKPRTMETQWWFGWKSKCKGNQKQQNLSSLSEASWDDVRSKSQTPVGSCSLSLTWEACQRRTVNIWKLSALRWTVWTVMVLFTSLVFFLHNLSC